MKSYAQNDSLNFSKRMATSYRMKMEEGNFITYCAPYGYRLDNGSLVIIEEEAVIVVRIFDMYLAGKGMGQIAATLNREGVPSREGKWNKAHIRYILSNEKYIGDALLQKTFTPEILPLRNRKNNGEKDKFYVTNSHPAIISREVFEAAQQRLILRGKLDLAKSQASQSDTVNAEVARIMNILKQTDMSFTEFDDVTVRRLVECIQVCGNKKIIVTLKGGYQAEEELKREVAA